MNTSTIDSVIEKITPVFNAVAEKIGQGAAWGWEVVLRQQVAYGVAYTIGALSAISVLVVCYKLFKWAAKEDVEEAVGGAIFLGLCASAMAIWMTIEASMRFINPEFYALQFFIGLVK